MDFFDRDGNALVVIPCAADSSSVTLDENGCKFALFLRNLLGGPEAPATFVLRTMQTHESYDIYFDSGRPEPFQQAAIKLGDGFVDSPTKDSDETNLFRRYIENLKALGNVTNQPQFKVKGAPPSSFESPTFSGQPFGSAHVTYCVRSIPSGEASVAPIPVLTLQRGYTAMSNDVVISANRAVATLFPGPFDLPIFTKPSNAPDPRDSTYHVVQFPSIDWLNTTLGASPLPETTVWHFETGEFPPDQIEQFWKARVLEPYVGGLRIINAPLPVSTVPSLSWDAAQNVDASWRIVRTAALASDMTTLKLLSERLLPGGYLTAESGDARQALPVACTLPAFRRHDSKALAFNALLQPWTNFDIEAERENSAGWKVPHSMQLQLTLDGPLASQPVRLGSLDLTFGGAFPADLDPDAFPQPAVRVDFELSPLDGSWIPRVYERGSLPVTRYGPGGEDEPVRDGEFRITPAPGSQETSAGYKRSSPIVSDPKAAAQRLKDSINAVQDKYLTSGIGQELSNLSSVSRTACDAVKARLHSAMDRLNGEQKTVLSAMLQEFPADALKRLNAIAATSQADLVAQVKALIVPMTTAAQTALLPIIGDVAAIKSAIDVYKFSLDSYKLQIKYLSDAISAAGGTATLDLRNAATTVAPGSDLRRQLDSAAAAVGQASKYILGNQGTGVTASIDGAIDVAFTQLSSGLFQVGSDVTGLTGLVTRAISILTPMLTAAETACAAASTTLANLNRSQLQTFFSTLTTNLTEDITAPAVTSMADVKAAYTKRLNGLTTSVATALSPVEAAIANHELWIDNEASTLCQLLSLDVNAMLQQLTELAKDELSSLLQNYASHLVAFESALQSMGDQIESQLKQVTAAVQQEAQTIVSGATGAALQVIRAFGEPPHVPTMGFQVPIDVPSLELPGMAYRFINALPGVDLTPARAMVSQVAHGLGSLSQLGVQLPTTQLLDRLVPASLQNFDLRDILPNFAGIDLSALFAGVRMPSVSNDTVRVTHHVDPQSKRASLDADIHVPLADETTILDLGPVTLLLENAEFTGHVHCEVTVGQQVTQTSSGEITGNWQLLIGGMEIVAFTQTTLSFDSSGKMQFSITPANVRLSEVLQFLADIVNSFTFGDSGFSIHVSAVPLSVQCILNLPLPDMSAGAFGIQNLHFGAVFEVGIDDNGFYLGVGANLARKSLPFILTVFVLGGAGWMEAYLRYQNGKATGEITIGMAASASLAIALGPISGSVSIDFGIFAEFAIGTGGGMQLGIVILIVGRVSLCGIIDANITLLLEAQYSSGGGLVGRGYVSVSIKICWCFTLNVHSSVNFTFGASKQTQNAPHPALQPAAAPKAVVAAPIAPAPVPASRTVPAAPTQATTVAPIDQYKQAALDYIDMLA